LEDIIERANLIIDRLRDIEHSRDYIVKDVYTSFYEQIKALEKLSRLLDKSEIFSLFRLYDRQTYYELREAFNLKRTIVEGFIGYLYKETIYIRIPKEFTAVEEMVIEREPEERRILERFFSSRDQTEEIRLIKDDYDACRKELAKIDREKAKRSIDELQTISENLKQFVIANFDISDLF
jgi:hypothetical protein